MYTLINNMTFINYKYMQIIVVDTIKYVLMKYYLITNIGLQISLKIPRGFLQLKFVMSSPYVI